jgi:hypothetical protein
MRDLPFPATQADTLPGTAPTVSPASEAGGLAHTRPKFPHRRVFVLASWQSANAWIEAAYPGGLDTARTELTAAFPELVANIDHLERAAEREATAYENTPAATPDAFSKALRAWEAAVLDALAALNHAHPREASHV